jgi:single-stranded-DNA-specific exonuclease
VELAADRVEEFRATFAAHAREVAPEGGIGEPERVDAVVGADALDLRVAEQFEGLAPFGQGNPAIKLLVPGARIGDIRPMGEEGKHARFNLSTGGASARGVAFNANGTLSAAQRAPHDITVRLEVNHWNGGVEPRAVLAGAHPRPASDDAPAGHGCPEAPDRAWWWERFALELERDPGEAVAAARPSDGREVIDTAGSGVARVAELLSSGARVLVLASDAGRRAALATAVGPPVGTAATVCLRCPPPELMAAAAAPDHSLLLTDWSSLAACPEAAAEFAHVVAVDPPADPRQQAAALGGTGFLHRAWGGREDLAERCWDAEWDLRGPLAEIYRSLAAERLSGEELRIALVGAGTYGRTPEAAARCARVLRELGLAECGSDGGLHWIGVVSSERTELERSGAWRAYSRTHEEGRRYLRTLRTGR